MSEFDVKLPDIMGWIVKWILILLALILAINMVLYFATPLLGNLKDGFVNVGRDPVSLGALCAILIAIVGVVKVATRK